MTELDYVKSHLMESYEINSSCLVLSSQLGAGAFGKVMKAVIKENVELPENLHGNMIVAVKMLKGKEQRLKDFGACIIIMGMGNLYYIILKFQLRTMAI